MSLPGRSHTWMPRAMRSTTVISGLRPQIRMRATAKGVFSAVSTRKTVELVRRRVSNAIERHGGISAIWSNGGQVSRVVRRVVWVVVRGMSVVRIVEVWVVARTTATVIDMSIGSMMCPDDFLLFLSLSPLLAKLLKF